MKTQRTKSPVRTYELCEYQKKSMSPNKKQKKYIQPKLNNVCSYDQFFNKNYKNSIVLTDINPERTKRNQLMNVNYPNKQNVSTEEKSSPFKNELGKISEDNLIQDNNNIRRFEPERNIEIRRDPYQIVNLQKEILNLQNELNNTKNYINVLKNENFNLTQLNQKNDMFLNQMQKELDNSKKENLNLVQLNHKNDMIINQMQNELNKPKQENFNYPQREQMEDTQLNKTPKEVINPTQENFNLTQTEQKNEMLFNQMQNELNNLKKENFNLNQINQKNEMLLNQLQNELNITKKDNFNLGQENQKNQILLEQMQKELNNSSQINEKKEEILNQMKIELKNSKKENLNLAKENQKSKTLLNEMQNELEESKKENESLRQENITLSNPEQKKLSISQLKSDLDNSEEEKDEFKKESQFNIPKKHFKSQTKYYKFQKEKGNEILTTSGNKTALVDDLKNEIDTLKDLLIQTEKERDFYRDQMEKLREENEKMLKEHKTQMNNLHHKNEELSKSSKDSQKFNKKLMKEKEDLQKTIALLENNKNQKVNKEPSENQILLNCLKNENAEIKELNEKYLQLLNLLFKFINDLNDLFQHDEIYLNKCKEDINVLIEDLNYLKEKIENLIGQNKESNENWAKIQNQLLGTKPIIKIDEENGSEEEQIQNDFKTGKCYACNIGRNVSLKGCSPYFVQKFSYSKKK